MPKALDITGQRFGKLVALSKAPSRSGKTYWLCQCDCGNQKEIQTDHLTGGKTSSCGCINRRGRSVIEFRKRIKIALVEAFGHKCAYCGLEAEPVLYDFHHLNPSEKKFGIGASANTHSRMDSWNEAQKCVMLCANCHRRIENGLITVNDLTLSIPNEEIYWSKLEELKNIVE